MSAKDSGASAPGSRPLPVAQHEQFARQVAVGDNPADAYVEAGIGALGLSLPEVTRLTAARVAWLREHPPALEPASVLSILASARKEIVAARNLGSLKHARADRLLHALELVEAVVLTLQAKLRP